MKVCAVIPVYNHEHAIGAVVAALKPKGLPLILVDDGSSLGCAQALDALAAREASWVSLVRLSVNGGKGAAVSAGLREAYRRGFTHALQLDADGQHDVADVPALLGEAVAWPRAVISGRPVFDASVPKGRLYGRYVTHVWVWINTLSLEIADAMCGFRVYPLEPTVRLLDSVSLGQRMDFDVEILVRLNWQGVPVRQIPTRVTYPADGISHFQPWGDNVRISAMHARLFFGMLWRSPWLLARKLRGGHAGSTHWARLGERGSLWGMKALLWVYRYFGRWLVQTLLYPLMLYFFLMAATARRASFEYLSRLGLAHPDLGVRANAITGFRHFLSMGETMVDKVLAFAGMLRREDVETHGRAAMADAVERGEGGLVLTGHLGNLEALSALSEQNAKLTLNILVHTRHAEKFQRLLAQVKPVSRVRLVEVTELGPDTVLDLSTRVAKGEWIVAAADRVPVGSDRAVEAEFLGAKARFPIGPHVLAGLLGCQVFFVVCLKLAGRHHVFYERFADQVRWTRATRDEVVRASAQKFAQRLEHYCTRAPLQWFNFYPFWAT